MDLAAVIEQTNNIILGKDDIIRKCLCCLLARGHVLVEDIPGVGKTTLAQSVAHLLGLQINRIQFTSDLLPADVTGVAIFSPEKKAFEVHRGPIFAEFILADEINRASPKSQSALLEAMEERQVTIEGQSYDLPNPFFVMATQNPVQQTGTYPLPESQLDRFMMRLHIGYPDKSSEIALIKGENPRNAAQKIGALSTPQELIAMQNKVDELYVSEELASYIHRLLQFSRECGEFSYGLSPRTGMSLVNAARAWAAISLRDSVMPDDVQTLFGDVVNHRLQWRNNSHGSQTAADFILDAVPVIE